LKESGVDGEPTEPRDSQADHWASAALHSLIETSSDLILLATSDGRLEFANSTALSDFGYSLEEISSLSVPDLVPVRFREVLLSRMQALWSSDSGGKLVGSGWDSGLKKDGGEFPIQATLSRWDMAGASRMVIWARDLTANKAIEDTLRKLGRAVDQSPVIVIITDTGGKIEYVNWKFTEVTGYSPEEVLGKTPRILKSGELPESIYKRMWDSITSGKDWRGEFHNKKKDGSYYWATATISSVRDAEGRITHFVAVQEDVTERKAQELRLGEVNETLGALVDASPLAVLTLDTSAGVKLWNSQAEKLFGWSAREVTGHFNPLVPADQVDDFVMKFRALLETGESRFDEVGCMRKDGTRLEASLITAPMHDPAGVAVGAVCLLTDISQRKKLEEGLRESEERFRHTFEDAPVGMTITELDGMYFRVNRAFSEMLGYTTEELQSISFESITHPEDLRANQELRRKLSSGEISTFTTEKRYVHKDGHTVWTILNVSSLHDAAGRRVYDLSIVQDISLRKAFERALEESEDRYRTLFEHSPIPLWEEDYSLARRELESLQSSGVVDVRSYLAARPDEVRRLLRLLRIVNVNQAGLAFHQARREELGGIDSMVDESSYGEEAALFAAVAKGETKFQAEIVNRTIRGELRNGELLMLVPPGYEGSYARVYIAISDITERRRSEEEVKRSEERYRSLFQDSPISIWEEDCSGAKTYLEELEARGITDLEGHFRGHPAEVPALFARTRLIAFNRATYDIYGAASEKELRKFLTTRGADRSEAFLKALLAFYRGGREFSTHIREKDVAGRDIYVSIKGTLTAGSEGTWERVLVSVMDITALKSAESELKASEERFRLTFHNAGVGMALATPAGVFVKANPAFCRMLGYSEAELVSMDWREITHKDDIQMDEEFGRLLLSGRIDHYHFEKRFLRKGGDPIWARITVSLIRDPAGKPLLGISMVEDISQARALADQLKEYSSRLEDKVEERTRELDESHKKLLEAERLATIGTVAAQVGHDLRNPLTTINTSLFYLRSVMAQAPQPRVRETMDYMEAAIMHANRIIEDLLTYSRQAPIKKVRLDLGELVRTAARSVIIPGQIKVHLGLGAGIRVAGDRSRLIRVFQNLIINSVDAMPAGGKLTITSSSSDAWVKVVISDTGVGMSKAQMEKLFVPLHTTKAQGLGMGLSICKRLVEVHGGKISATSRLGRGSVFTVELPRPGARPAKPGNAAPGSKAPRAKV
jgi:PAS domain S-box-containing protein